MVQNDTTENENPEGLWRWDESMGAWKLERDPETTISPRQE
ncbi:hypothetical protein ACFQL7_25485 [Halocatena marina]|uniref:Uncharacterized protein n=3 Tax=Halocatena marina TaxID=2934937 RepID=A0ABD5YU07_9EURY